MRLPYLQVTQETWTRARMLAGALACDRHRALAMLLDLWAWGLDLGPLDAFPTGVCAGPLARVMLAGVLDWTGDHNHLADALDGIGALELLPDGGLRVRGLDRYRPTWERQRGRSEAGKKAAGARWDAETMRPECVGNASPMRPVCDSDAIAMRPDAKTQTQTQTQILLPSEVVRPPPKTPAEGFWAWAQERRASAGCVPEKLPHLSKLSAWYAEALGELGGDEERLREAVFRFGDDPFWQAKTPPCPFAGFMAQWRKYAPRANQPAA